MKPLHILLGTGTVLGLALLLGSTSSATPGRLPVPPPPPPPPPPMPPLPSTPLPGPVVTLGTGVDALISRSIDPPASATVPPGFFIATWDGLTLLAKNIDHSVNTVIGPVPEGTPLGSIRIGNQDAVSRGQVAPTGLLITGGDFPIVWVSPDAQRIAFRWGSNDETGAGTISSQRAFGIPAGSILIAHRP